MRLGAMMATCPGGCGRVIPADVGYCRAHLMAISARAARHFDAVRFQRPTASRDWMVAVTIAELQGNHDTHGIVDEDCPYCRPVTPPEGP